MVDGVKEGDGVDGKAMMTDMTFKFSKVERGCMFLDFAKKCRDTS